MNDLKATKDRNEINSFFSNITQKKIFSAHHNNPFIDPKVPESTDYSCSLYQVSVLEGGLKSPEADEGNGKG